MTLSLVSSITSSLTGIGGGGKAFSATNELTNAACWTALNIKDVEVDSSSMNTLQPVSQEQVTSSSTYTSLLAADIQVIKILNPSKMRITAFSADPSALNAVIASFMDTKSTVKITTKGITAKSMTVISVDIEQTPQMTSATKVVIELEQVTTPTSASSGKAAQATDASTQKSLLQSLPSSAATVVGAYNKVSNFLR
jgi:hypothetical protein